MLNQPTPPPTNAMPSPQSVNASGRKKACQVCRQRKKKCDGESPCASCTKLKAQCIYGPTSQTYAPSVADDSGIWSIPGASPYRINDADSLTPREEAAVWNWQRGLTTNIFASAASHIHQFTPTGTPGSPPSSQTPPSSGPPPPPPLNFESLISCDIPHTGITPLGFDALQDGLATFPFAMPTAPPSSHLSAGTPAPSSPGVGEQIVPLSPPVQGPSPSQSPPTLRRSLPQPHDLKNFFDIFFERYHMLLPCLHKPTLYRELQTGALDLETNPLPYIISALAVKAHSDPSVRQRSEPWLQHAVMLFDENVKTLQHPLNSLSAGVWIVFQYFVEARMSEMWVFLGKTCRLASLLGFDRIDSRGPKSPFAPKPRSALEKEQRRQVMWALFLLDHLLSALCGWALALDDRHFMVNYPLDSDQFEASKCDIVEEEFSMDLSMLSQTNPELDLSKPHPMKVIYKSCVLLGRILTHTNNVHSIDPAVHDREFAELEDAMGKFCLAYSRDARSMWLVPQESLDSAIWLEIIIQMCIILLYHPKASSTSRRSSPANSRAASVSNGQETAGSPGAAAIISAPDQPDPKFIRCLHAMHKTVVLVRETSSRSVKALLNPFLVPAYFLSCRFLAICWHENKDPKFRQNLDLMLMLIDRCAQIWTPLAGKYKMSILADLNRTAEEASRMKVGTGSYLSDSCMNH